MNFYLASNECPKVKIGKLLVDHRARFGRWMDVRE
jgi:hypothetical protein